MKKRFLLSSLLALSIIGCSTPMINTNQDFTDFEKEYKSFSTKALSDAYVKRMFGKYLAPVNTTQLTRQLEFSRYLKAQGDTSYETSLKNMFAQTPSLYDTMTGASAPAIQQKMSTESSTFGTFVRGISPYPGVPVATSPTNIASTSFTANWTSVSGATSYKLKVDSGAYNDIGNETSFAVTGLTAGTTHTYSVQAVNSSGTSDGSGNATVTLLPATPVGLSAANVTTNSFTANWSPVSGATGYEIVTDNNAPLSAATNSYDVSGLTGINHTFKVRAVNISGAGAYSSQIDVTLLPASPPAGIILVNASATGLNNGSSWANAYTSLQSALSVATSGKDIWVASGTYKPSIPSGRTATFQLISGVRIYGGFAGTETDVSQRNFNTNIVTLSCDISGNDSDVKPNATTPLKTDNCYHVVKGTTGATLDGVTVKFGYADGAASPDWFGGGMSNNGSSSPTLSNVIFSYNFAARYGAGMYNSSSSPALTNVTFSNNYSDMYGAGMYNSSSSPTLTNVVFSNNTAYNGGGGMSNNSYSSPTLTKVIFYGNSASGYGGGIYTINGSISLTNVVFANNSAPYGGALSNLNVIGTLTNVTFSGNTASLGNSLYNDQITNPTTVTVKNTVFWGASSPQIAQSSSTCTLKIEKSDVQGGFAGISGGSIKDLSDNTLTSGNFASVGNINSNPNFVNTSDLAHLIGTDGIWMTSDDGLALQSGSPARNTGTNTGAPATDIIGTSRPRPVVGNVDMGAYEFIE